MKIQYPGRLQVWVSSATHCSDNLTLWTCPSTVVAAQGPIWTAGWASVTNSVCTLCMHAHCPLFHCPAAFPNNPWPSYRNVHRMLRVLQVTSQIILCLGSENLNYLWINAPTLSTKPDYKVKEQSHQMSFMFPLFLLHCCVYISVLLHFCVYSSICAAQGLGSHTHHLGSGCIVHRSWQSSCIFFSFQLFAFSPTPPLGGTEYVGFKMVK